MDKTINQIVIGEVPEKIQECMNTVETWAAQNNYEYKVITEIPKQYSHLPVRIATDYMRVDLLQEPYRAYADWDIEIKHNILLSDDPLFAGDYILYRGKDISILSQIKDMMQPIRPMDGQIWSALRVIGKSQNIKKYFIDKSSYLHKHFSRRRYVSTKQ